MLQIKTLESGLTLIVEEMPHFESVAYELQIPGGIVTDQEQGIGHSLILGEMLARGAGELDSRALSDAFDRLGIRHGEGAGSDRFYLRGSLLSEHLGSAIDLVSTIVQQPTLPEEHLDAIRSLLSQEIAALSDNPARRAAIALNGRYYPAPYNRSPLGDEQAIARCNVRDLRELWSRTFRPKGAILSLAGKVNIDQALELVNKSFKGWQGAGVSLPAYQQFPAHSKHHIQFDGAQLQILLSYPSANFGHELFYTAKVAAGILSGGMFGRLFVEVREKRGLCYSVSLRHSSNKEYGVVTAYAGTTPERAHETLQVILDELKRVRGTVSAEELKRAKANLKAQMIISEESPGSRASSNAGDWFIARRVRSLEEIAAAIDAVDFAALDRYFETFASNSFMLLTLGAREL